jgi:flagellar protein FliO/FliZ
MRGAKHRPEARQSAPPPRAGGPSPGLTASASSRLRGLAARAVPWSALAAPGTALAQSPAGPSYLPMLLALGLVLALIPALVWLLRRFGAAPSAAVGAAALKVVAQLPLGPRERLVVVEAGGRWLLLGVTAGAISRVGTLPRPADAADPAADAESAVLTFRQLMRQVAAGR